MGQSEVYLKRKMGIEVGQVVSEELFEAIWLHYAKSGLSIEVAEKLLKDLREALGVSINNTSELILKKYFQDQEQFLNYDSYKTLFLEISQYYGITLSDSLKNKCSLEPTATTIKVKVYLNIYDLWDLSGVNDYLVKLGFGAFHCGVAVYDWEFSFGYPEGIFVRNPRQGTIGKFRETIEMGYISKNRIEIIQIIKSMKSLYKGENYNILEHNCNHFCDDFCIRLVHKQIPKKYNKLAHFASEFKGILGDISVQKPQPNSQEPTIMEPSRSPRVKALENDLAVAFAEPLHAVIPPEKIASLQDLIETVRKSGRNNQVTSDESQSSNPKVDLCSEVEEEVKDNKTKVARMRSNRSKPVDTVGSEANSKLKTSANKLSYQFDDELPKQKKPSKQQLTGIKSPPNKSPRLAVPHDFTIELQLKPKKRSNSVSSSGQPAHERKEDLTKSSTPNTFKRTITSSSSGNHYERNPRASRRSTTQSIQLSTKNLLERSKNDTDSIVHRERRLSMVQVQITNSSPIMEKNRTPVVDQTIPEDVDVITNSNDSGNSDGNINNSKVKNRSKSNLKSHRRTSDLKKRTKTKSSTNTKFG